ncbi:MAG TPA: hypothetical protein VJR29_04305 [bacterium]|nr:hypothetical protein [bacterium]
MPTALSKLFTLSASAFLAGAVACTGMSPGGGGASPAEVAQGGGGAPVAIGNSLDSAGPNGPGPNLGGDTGGGQAQPSTQQSSEGIGAPCVINFQVSVKTTRSGVPEACSNAVARINLDNITVNDGEMAPPDLPPTGPTVTMKFLFTAEDNPFNVTESKTTQCIGGVWQTENFLFRYPGKALDCSGFHQVTAQAAWLKDGQSLSSSTFQGPPLPEADENFIVPLEVTLELNGSGTTSTHSIDVNPNTVLSQ